MKSVFILRSVSGAGKSTVANAIAGKKSVICTADDYFSLDGEYKFDVSKLGAAHNWCFNEFKSAVDDPKVNTVILANTNTSYREFKHYKEYAEDCGHMVFVLVVENWHGGENVHNVPKETLIKQETRLRNSLKLS